MNYFDFLDNRKGIRALFIAQTLCVLFFIGDAIREFTNVPEKIGFINFEVFEFVIVIVMVISMIATGRQLVNLRAESGQLKEKLRAASGEFNAVLHQSFQEWGLTSSESDVALLAVKGLGISEISVMRETKEGTIKAQLNAIYKKANVSGRPQLISFFVEELMTGNFTDGAKSSNTI
ncbi:helix-turn-helix transcriptional regulator [Lentilitoribacter sp. EG35]|uniref:helix-turn-helix transcriptional regulator n=1 Tax=Lentilitoribacter sp. EG35 TaxID=3234192 RepID=UPI00346036D5